MYSYSLPSPGPPHTTYNIYILAVSRTRTACNNCKDYWFNLFPLSSFLSSSPTVPYRQYYVKGSRCMSPSTLASGCGSVGFCSALPDREGLIARPLHQWQCRSKVQFPGAKATSLVISPPRRSTRLGIPTKHFCWLVLGCLGVLWSDRGGLMTYYTAGQQDEREKCERVDFPPPRQWKENLHGAWK